jgi:hypothetical protein
MSGPRLGRILVALLGVGLALAGCGSGAKKVAPLRPIRLAVAGSVRLRSMILGPAVGDGSVWIPAADGVLRFDPATLRQVARIPTPGVPAGVAVGPSGVWVTVATHGYQYGELLRIDPATNRVTATVSLGFGEPFVVVVLPHAVIAENSGNSGTLLSVDPRTDTVARHTLAVPNDGDIAATAGDVVAGAGSLWVGEQMSPVVTRVDPVGLTTVGGPIDLPTTVDGGSADGVLYAFGALWVGDDPAGPLDAASVVRVDPATRARHAIATPAQAMVSALVSAYGRVFAIGSGNAIEIDQIDPATGARMGPTTTLSGDPSYDPSAASGEGAIWVVTDGNRLTKLVAR